MESSTCAVFCQLCRGVNYLINCQHPLRVKVDDVSLKVGGLETLGFGPATPERYVVCLFFCSYQSIRSTNSTVYTHQPQWRCWALGEEIDNLWFMAGALSVGYAPEDKVLQ